MLDRLIGAGIEPIHCELSRGGEAIEIVGTKEPKQGGIHYGLRHNIIITGINLTKAYSYVDQTSR
jgi:hypothetical protein